MARFWLSVERAMVKIAFPAQGIAGASGLILE
jgi:hypothetical protein